MFKLSICMDTEFGYLFITVGRCLEFSSECRTSYCLLPTLSFSPMKYFHFNLNAILAWRSRRSKAKCIAADWTWRHHYENMPMQFTEILKL